MACSVCQGRREPSGRPCKAPGGSRLLRGPCGAAQGHLPLCVVEVTEVTAIA